MNKHTHKFLTALLLVPLAALHASVPLADPMSQWDSLWMQFSNPPMKARMMRIEHGWNADPEMVKAKVARMKALGFGGCVSSLPCVQDYATSDGNFRSLEVSDVAVLYPIESAWVHMKPSRHWAGDLGPEARAIGQAQKEVTQSLFEAGRDYDYIDSQSLAAARIEEQELVCGRLRYRVVVLPAVDTLSADAWAVLNRFCETGGRVVFVATQPRNSLKEFPCGAIQADMARILERYRTRCVFLPFEKASTVGSVVDGWLTRVLEISTPSPLRVTQRLVGSIGVLYIMNDSDREWQGTIRVNASDKPLQIWNPSDGCKRPASDPHSLEIKLEAWSSLICVSEGLQRTKIK